MGGLPSIIDQPLINDANFCKSASLNLNTSQVSLVASGVLLGAIGGALPLGPTNKAVGHNNAILISLVLYTISAAFEAGAISFGTIAAARTIVGIGLGLESGTVPIYVTESVARKHHSEPVSLLPIRHYPWRSLQLCLCSHPRQRPLR
jgi:MFS family permease